MDYKICAPETCTLCMACANVCPKDAIFVDTDAYGYEKIAIDREKCIACGQCFRVCRQRGNVSGNTPALCFAAQAKSTVALEKSASGGAFQMLAQIVLEKGGICYGCAFEKKNGRFQAGHIRVDSSEKLTKILNSKYIPSAIGSTFTEAKRDLEAGKLVLFSGTPCQIQGLKVFLGGDYDNLLLVDLICHGVTSTGLFNDYLACIENRDGIEITDFSFRDKSVSWGTNYCYSYRKRTDPKERQRHCPREASSYMWHYLRGNIFRENCYSCDRANAERVSDFTVGDYWEIESEHPEYVTKCKPRIVLRKGVSCILINSLKAQQYAKLLGEKMVLHEVTLESITAHNSNLTEPSGRGKDREYVLDTYRKSGYAPLEAAYRRSVGKKIAVYYLKNSLKSCMPDRIRIMIYRTPVLRKIIFRQ